MTIGPLDEEPRRSDDPAFRDAVTFAFGDPAAKLYGLARVGIGGGGTSGFAIVYAGDRLVGATTQAQDVAGAEVESWESLTAAGVRFEIVSPLEAWTVGYAGEEAKFDLRFEALSAPAVLDADAPVAQIGGTEGYDQVCVVTGTVSHGGRTYGARCLGQRGHQWGMPDWSRIDLARSLSAWMGPEKAVTLTAVRPAKSRHHGEEAVAAFLVDRGEPRAIFDARLSTTYDGELRQRRAGLELWMSAEGGYARRAAGEVVCGTTVDLGDLRLDSAFFQWRMEGRTGTGRYDVMRRVDGDGDGGGRRRRRGQ